MRNIFLLFAVFISCFLSRGQGTPTPQEYELPKIIPGSPSVTTLMHFEEVPIDYYTGQPDIQLPIYVKRLGPSLTIPISLRYTTMNLRIDERSGWTGRGWALDGEAMISRTVRHIRDEARLDDQELPIRSPFEVGIYHNGFFEVDFERGDASDEELQRFLWNATGKGSGSQSIFGGDYDKEPDLYQLSLFGKHARFVIIKNIAGTLEVKMLSNDANLKVVPNYDSVTYSISSFTVTDTNAITYTMSITETNTSDSSTTSVLQNEQTSESDHRPKTHISAWKVKEIRNGSNQLLATYNYDTITESFQAPISYVEANFTGAGSTNMDFLRTFIYDDGLGNPTDDLEFRRYNASLTRPKRSVSYTSVSVASQKIRSIEFIDGSSIDFLLGSQNHPEYDNSGGVLEEIKIFDANDILFIRFDLVYEVTQNDILFLDRLDEYHKQDTNPLTYDLTYRDKEFLPVPPSPSDNTYQNKDLWGYYKQAEPPGTLSIYGLPEKSADKEHVSTGSLTAISYPTGGKKEFEFESNHFSSMGFRDFNEWEFKNLNPDNWDWSGEAQVFFTPNAGTPILDDQDYFTITDEQEVILEYSVRDGDLDDPTVADYLQNVEVRLDKVIQQPGGDVVLEHMIGGFIVENIGQHLEVHSEEKLILPPGEYRLYYLKYSSSDGSGLDTETSARVRYKTFKEDYDSAIHGGGLRIGSITFRDADNSIKRQFTYNYTEAEIDTQGIPGAGPHTSTGVIDGFLTNIKEYEDSDLLTYLAVGGYQGVGPVSALTANLPGSGNTTFIIPYRATPQFHVKEYLNSVNVSLTKNNYVGYKKVSISEYDNGRSVYEYTSPSDFPTYHESYFDNTPFLPLKDKSHLHGALLKQRVHDSEDRLIREITNTYHDPIEISKAFWLFTEYGDVCNWDQFYNTYDNYIAKSVENFGPDPYHQGGFGDNCVVVSEEAPVFYQKAYHYYNRYLLEESLTKDYFYDGSGTSSIVETRETFEYDTSNYKISTQNTYLAEGSNEVHYQKKFHYPSSPFSTNYSNYFDLVNQNKVEEVVATETYRDSEMISSTYTTYNNFEPSSSLPENVFTSKGDVHNPNPEIPGSVLLLDRFHKRVVYHNYDVYGNPLEVSRANGPMISYIWGYNGLYPIAKIENADYEKIRQAMGLSSQQDVEDLDQDDMTSLNSLRNHASMSDSMVTTLTYDPLIGVTSITDPSGQTIHYEYDDFNRLKEVRDRDNNLVSDYQYNYKGQ
ncbi:MAG: RHS repeat domain-containing protein [Allomuricauda sp.]